MALYVRQTELSDLPIFVKWMNDEGWIVSLNMLDACYLLDPKGWMTAETEDGEIIGSIAGCKLDEKVAFGSFFIVRKDWRRRGVGKMLLDQRMKNMGEINLGINSVESRVEYNKMRGFDHMSFTIYTYIGVPEKSKLVTLDDTNLVKCTPELFEDLYKYDTEIHTVPREDFLKFWLKEELTVTYCALDGGVRGYGCIKPVDGGHYRIGPLFADTPELAQSLFTKLMFSVPDRTQVTCDIPADNALSMSIVQKHGMLLNLKLYRMYTKKVMKFNMENVYAFTTVDIALV